jgi:phage RecT family recombinase
MSNAIATRQPQGGIAALIENAAPRLAAALPAFFSAEKMAQVVSILACKTPKLQQCDPETLITAIITAGSLGLDLTPTLGEGYLIPRENWKTKVMECTFMPGYQGLAKLAHQTGAVVFIQAREVCEGDEFEVLYNPDLTYRHRPKFGRDRGEVTHVYAVAKLTSGDHLIEVLTADELESIHRRSEGYQAAQRFRKDESGPWVSDRLEMEKKTAVRRLCKRLPRATTPATAQAFANLATAIECDNRQYEIDGDERPVLEHHAINHDNQTGHGSGAYAPPAVVDEYRAWLRRYVDKVNAAWLDRVTARMDLDDVPKNMAELTNPWQLGNHLVKFARDAGAISAPEESRVGQTDKLAAVWWMRDKAALTNEAKRYVASLHAVKLAKLFPEPDEPAQAPPVEAEDDSQDGDPDVDIVIPGERVPGEDG